MSSAGAALRSGRSTTTSSPGRDSWGLHHRGRYELPDVPGLAERWGRSVLLSVLSRVRVQRTATGHPERVAHVHSASDADCRMGANDALSEWRCRARCSVACRAGEAWGRHRAGASERTAWRRCPAIRDRAQGRRTSELDALYLSPQTRLNSDIGQQLGCDLDEGPFGSVIRTDGAQMTTLSGTYRRGGHHALRPQRDVGVRRWRHCRDGCAPLAGLLRAGSGASRFMMPLIWGALGRPPPRGRGLVLRSRSRVG
jgi:hypothetical protein